MIRRADSHKWWVLAALVLSVLAVGMDGTILSVALPTLAHVLHASEANLQWFQSGYLLVLAVAMLPAGLLGDRYGRKKVLVGALLLFGAGSAASAFSPSPTAFILARTVLGAAGAGVIVMVLSAMTVVFSPEERPRAVGVWAAANFLALPIGPILGGFLLTHYWWGWVFLLNVPVVLLGLVATLTLMPESRATNRPNIDVVGILSSMTGLAGLTYGLIEAGTKGWSSTAAVVPMAVGLVMLGGFVLWERRLNRRGAGQALVDLTLFRSRAYTWGVILLAVEVLAMIGVLFTMPQYFQGVLGVDAMGSGLRLLPLIGGLVLGAVPADRVAARAGAKATTALGFAFLAAGLSLGTTMHAGSSLLFVAGWMAITGFGMGLSMATASSAALSAMPEEESGMASAVLQAVQKVGAPFGAAILGSVLSAAYLAHLDLSGLPGAVAAAVRQSVFGGVAAAQQMQSAALLQSVRTAFMHGMDQALVVSAGIAIVGVVLAVAFLPGRATRTAGSPSKPAVEEDVPAVGWDVRSPSEGRSWNWVAVAGLFLVLALVGLAIRGVLIENRMTRDLEVVSRTTAAIVGAQKQTLNRVVSDLKRIEATEEALVATSSPQERTPEQAVPAVEILTTSAIGRGTVVPDHGSYREGSTVLLQAIPAPGWHFVAWSGDVSGAENSVSVTMDATKGVAARFAADTFTITASAGAGGSIAPSGAVNAGYDANQLFIIIPAAGWRVAQVEVDGVPVGAVTRYAFTLLRSDHTIAVRFAPNAPSDGAAP